ncbi:MAG: TSCPD domain-containing protein [Desulfuromonadaceae bacterium]|nr:TSCPD domain-containing protein [Desulfuromonadaceae bacterium]
MSPKTPRPKAVTGFTIERRSACGKIYTTVTLSPSTATPMEVFIRFGKAGGCGSAMADGIARLVSYGLRSGLEATDAFKALTGIGCHLGSNTCLNCVAESIGIVLEHLKTGRDLNELIEEADFAALNHFTQGAEHHEI